MVFAPAVTRVVYRTVTPFFWHPSRARRRDGGFPALKRLGTKCLGKRPSKEPSRRVRYDRAQLIPEVFLVEMCAVFLKEG